MMKLLLIVCLSLVVLIAGVSLGMAIDLSYGVKGGVGFANFVGDDVPSSNDSRLGFSAGAFGEFELINMVKLQPELLFSLKGSKADPFTYNYYYIDVPVLVKFYPPIAVPVAKLNAFAGPYAGVNIIAKLKDNGTTTDVKDDVKLLDFGLVIGAGADIKKFTVDARYAFGLTKIAENDDSVKNSLFAVMVGYRLK
jgi:hypothetical protein